jgi:SEC-C motif domain protein
MRSRYSAFALGLPDYLSATWHTSTRPAEIEIDPGLEWRRLDILGTTAGGILAQEGEVEYRALFRSAGARGTLHERSRFVRVGGAWRYLDGTILPD